MDAVTNNGKVLLQGGGQKAAVSRVTGEQEQQRVSVTAVAGPIFRQNQQLTAPSALKKTAPINVINPPSCSYIDRAVRMVKESTFPAGQRIEAYILIAEAKAAAGDTQGALVIFFEAKRFARNYLCGLYPIIDALIEQGDVDRALHALKEMYIDDTRLVRQFKIAEAIAKKGDLNRALKVANQGLEGPNSIFFNHDISLAGILREGIKQNKITEKEAIEMVVAFQNNYKSGCHSVDHFLESIAESKAEGGDINAAFEVVKKMSMLDNKRNATHSIIKIAARSNVYFAIMLAAKNHAAIKALAAYHPDMYDSKCGTESAKAMLVIVKFQIENKNIEGAVKIAQQIPDGNQEKNQAWNVIVKAYADAGEIGRARNFASKITIKYIQEQAEMAILQARVEVLKEKITKEMLDAVAKLQSNSLKSEMLLFFIQTDPSRKNIDNAEMIANSIRAWNFKGEVKISVVRARLNYNDINGAERTASEMDDTYIKDNARKEIALAYLKAGSFVKAINTSRLILRNTKYEVLISIAQFCIENNKNIDRVISIPKAISDSEGKNKVLIAIVKALLKRKMLVKAAALGQEIVDPLTRVKMLIEMDKTQKE